MTLVSRIFEDAGVPDWVKHAAIKRIEADPGLPVVNPTKSFWLSDVHPDFSSTQSLQPPSSAYCVIIGSGITGTSVARQLVRFRLNSSDAIEHRKEKIVLLEAREICDGATGRNGGHINEVGFADYEEIKEKWGKDAAMKILRFRLNHLATLKEVAAQEGLEIESQIRKINSATIFFTDEAWNYVKGATTSFKGDFGEEAVEWEIVESEEGLKMYGTEAARGIIIGRAGAAWPYRLITGILSNLKRDDPNFSIHSFTPVTAVERSFSGQFIVSTPHGKITAKHVIHCTNSHVSHLVPGLRNRVFPVRGQMSAQTPPLSFPYQGDRLSWSFNYEAGFDYLTQLPKQVVSKSAMVEGAELMLGGGMVQATYHGLEELGITRDDKLNPELGDHLSNALSQAFTPSREVDSEENKFKVKAMWTGIMGFSADSMPWVGKLPRSLTGRTTTSQKNKDEDVEAETDIQGAEWVSAGYTGEGMVNAWLCGKALAMMICGQEGQIQDWFPEQYGISEQRLRESVVDKVVHV